ncbi:hypothetical protein PR048_025001 [Dryococelus australis]|uniref:Uncharacterized protein n=1 Tax=Dryococelus australis TaxID=614101 RepID=A0ABQ9GQ52_9NEOP|nr:hypothetical protein PR048_025001 [Dryococelus australis]
MIGGTPREDCRWMGRFRSRWGGGVVQGEASREQTRSSLGIETCGSQRRRFLLPCKETRLLFRADHEEALGPSSLIPTALPRASFLYFRIAGRLRSVAFAIISAGQLVNHLCNVSLLAHVVRRKKRERPLKAEDFRAGGMRGLRFPLESDLKRSKVTERLLNEALKKISARPPKTLVVERGNKCPRIHDAAWRTWELENQLGGKGGSETTRAHTKLITTPAAKGCGSVARPSARTLGAAPNAAPKPWSSSDTLRPRGGGRLERAPIKCGLIKHHQRGGSEEAPRRAGRFDCAAGPAAQENYARHTLLPPKTSRSLDSLGRFLQPRGLDKRARPPMAQSIGSPPVCGVEGSGFESYRIAKTSTQAADPEIEPCDRRTRRPSPGANLPRPRANTREIQAPTRERNNNSHRCNVITQCLEPASLIKLSSRAPRPAIPSPTPRPHALVMTSQPRRSARAGGGGEERLPSKTRRPEASSGTIFTCENPGRDPARNLA